MEQYFVVQITKTKDSTAYATAITVKETENEARMLYHQTMASILATPNIEYAQVYIDDYAGNKVYMETVLPTPEPPEPEE